MVKQVAWLRHKLAWSNSRQSWHERLAGLLLVLLSAGVIGYGSGLALSRQVVLWSILLLAWAAVLRRGWVKLFGPVLFYDLVRTARRGRYHLARTTYGFVLLCCFYLYGAHANKQAAVSEQFFYVFMVIQFVTVFLITPPYTAGAITEEKENKTLEFLLATDLRNREIVLGKLVARLANMSLLLLFGLPVLSLVQFLGGVDPLLVLAGFAGTFLSMSSLASLSILCSVYTRRSLNALLLTYLIAAGYLALSGVARVLYQVPFLIGLEVIGSVTVDDLVAWSNAGNLPVALYRLGVALSVGGLAGTLPDILREYAIFHGLATLLCCCWAVARLRAVSLKQAFGPARSSGGPARELPPVGRWPMLWKEIYAEPGLRFGWLGRCGIGLFVLLSFVPPLAFLAGTLLRAILSIFSGFFPFGNEQPQWDLFVLHMNQWVEGFGTILACLMLLGVTVHAAGTVTGERARQTLDGLLTTPQSTRAILLAKSLGGVFCLRWAWYWMGAIASLGLLTNGLRLSALPGLLLAWLVYAVFFAFLGLLCSTWCRSTLKATIASLSLTALIWVSPWILGGLIEVTLEYLIHRNVIAQHFWTAFETWFECGKALSPPVTLALFAHDASRSHSFFRDESIDGAGRFVAWVCLVGYGLLSILLWERSCRRFRADAGPSPGQRPREAEVSPQAKPSVVEDAT